jgi:hypothetical protein
MESIKYSNGEGKPSLEEEKMFLQGMRKMLLHHMERHEEITFCISCRVREAFSQGVFKQFMI